MKKTAVGPRYYKKIGLGKYFFRWNLTLFRFQNPTSRHWVSIYRQEVPIHLRCFYQRKNLQVSTSSLSHNHLGVSSFPPRWAEPSFSEEITFITSRNTTDSRRDITTYQPICLQLSQESEVEILLPLDNADQSPKPSDSTWSESRRRELKVTLERPLSCSEELSAFEKMQDSWLTRSNQLQHFEWSHSLSLAWLLQREKINTLCRFNRHFRNPSRFKR